MKVKSGIEEHTTGSLLGAKFPSDQ